MTIELTETATIAGQTLTRTVRLEDINPTEVKLDSLNDLLLVVLNLRPLRAAEPQG